VTLKELLTQLMDPDHIDGTGNPLSMEVEFNTAYRNDLYLLSCYTSDGKVLIDIGGDDG